MNFDLISHKRNLPFNLDGHINILDIVVDGYEMRCPVYMGSKNDIVRVDKFIKDAEDKGEQELNP